MASTGSTRRPSRRAALSTTFLDALGACLARGLPARGVRRGRPAGRRVYGVDADWQPRARGLKRGLFLRCARAGARRPLPRAGRTSRLVRGRLHARAFFAAKRPRSRWGSREEGAARKGMSGMRTRTAPARHGCPRAFSSVRGSAGSAPAAARFRPIGAWDKLRRADGGGRLRVRVPTSTCRPNKPP